eukprot:GABW01004794.1.p1 GENE.GABW01004794.1~~GABW01004794.1.p1  ORF type:complete len:149 (-),score=24.52 GABW01004794.1:3-449(-)
MVLTERTAACVHLSSTTNTEKTRNGQILSIAPLTEFPIMWRCLLYPLLGWRKHCTLCGTSLVCLRARESGITFGIGIPCYGIDFSYTKASGHLRDELMSNTTVIYQSEREFAYYRMQAYPVWSMPEALNSHFKSMIDNLPTTCATHST